MPKVSVVIPSYNGAAHIRAAVESVLMQDFADLELIVVDDGSRDDTIRLVEEFRDDRIDIHRNHHNHGAEQNWSKGLKLAKGAYVKLLPQDDLLLPGILREQVEVLEQDTAKSLAFVFGGRQIIDASGKVLLSRGLRKVGDGRVSGAWLTQQCVRRGTNVIGEPGAVLLRREFADRVGHFDASQPYVIDLDYWLRMLQLGDAWYMGKPVAAFRVSAGSWSVAIGVSQSRQYTEFLRRARRERLVSVSAADLLLGRTNAWLNNLARLAFYKLVIR